MYSPFLRILSSGLSRSMIRFTRGVCIFAFFLTISMLSDICLKGGRCCYLCNLRRPNSTIPYTEIRASLFKYSRLDLLLWGMWGVVCFVFSNLVVIEILWAYDNWFSSIITLLKYPTASYTNIINYVKTLITVEKVFYLRERCSGFQLHLQPWVKTISHPALCAI